MSVFNRISDIINSNINTMLDHAEDPEKMIRQITREMEETLVEVRSHSARNIAEKKDLVHRIAKYTEEAASWEKRAELAVNKGREDLARAALKEKTALEEAVTHMEKDAETVEGLIGKLKQDTVQLKEKLDYARTRQKALIMRGQTAQSRIRVKRQLHHASWNDAMVRFEHYERKLDDMEGAIESYDLGNRTLADEIRDLEEEERLDAELQALKDRMARNTVTQVETS